MANNVQITAGAGTTIETIDEGSGVERQVIVLGGIGKAGGETQLSGGQTTSANSIPVVIASDQSTHPVTANAGTNLNTSALALESGGNLATLAGAVSSSKMAIKSASGDLADGAITTLGAKTDAKNSATDTTSVSAMSVWKQISAYLAAALAVTQSGTWTVQPGNTANTTAWKVDGSAVTQPASIADGSHSTFGAKADAKSAATDTTAISAMSVWKQISASIQAAAASLAGTLTVATHAVTQSGTWTVQPGNTANTTAWKVDGSAVTQPVSGTITANAGTNLNTSALALETGGNLATLAGAVSSSKVQTKEIRSSTGTQSSVASSASDGTILASNANRLGAIVYNDSTQVLYLLLASGTSSSSVYSVQLASNDYYEVPAFYTGVIKGIWASANGNARVTEFT